MIRAEGIHKSFHGLVVLADVSLVLGVGQKAALVGSNGVGKSTLLKILAGIEQSDRGNIEVEKGASIGYLPQELEVSSKQSIAQYVKQMTGMEQLERRMAELEPHLVDEKKMLEYSQLQDVYSRLDGYAFDHRLQTILRGFGLLSIPERTSVAELSGGQKSKVLLAAILLKGVDVLLLDEPTNNLDLPALIWLESYLQQSKATCLIVSHDRRFLDAVVAKVFEIDWFSRKLITHTGTYSEYLTEKERESRRKREVYERQQAEVQRLEKVARQSKNWALRGAKQTTSDKDKFSRGFRRDRSARIGSRAKAVEKRIEQMEKIETPRERQPLIIPLEPRESDAHHAIRLESVVAGYPTRFRLAPVTLTIDYGSRVCILGDNGVGKTTLLKVITGFLPPLSGSVIIGPSLVLGNLMQEHENVPHHQTLKQFLHEKAGLDDQNSFHLLRKFGFEKTEASKLIGDISPGGRARLILALFSAQSVNVLILDEPTNHLDLEATEALENLLSSYTGTVVVVSHDRYFLEHVGVTHTYLLEDGKLQPVSSYNDYVRGVTDSVRRMLKSLGYFVD